MHQTNLSDIGYMFGGLSLLSQREGMIITGSNQYEHLLLHLGHLADAIATYSKHICLKYLAWNSMYVHLGAIKCKIKCEHCCGKNGLYIFLM